jgi:hypothetical protein
LEADDPAKLRAQKAPPRRPQNRPILEGNGALRQTRDAVRPAGRAPVDSRAAAD